jgi:hypothetical protein
MERDELDVLRTNILLRIKESLPRLKDYELAVVARMILGEEDDEAQDLWKAANGIITLTPVDP